MCLKTLAMLQIYSSVIELKNIFKEYFYATFN